jgi:hypothetical protein
VESVVRQHVWLWSDIEVAAELPIACDHRGACWIDGDKLFDFICRRPQFIWSVLSAIPAESRRVAEEVDCVPFADGNRSFWVGSTTPQHPMASFEIVCWDSSATLLIGANAELAEAFRLAYPDAVCLDG